MPRHPDIRRAVSFGRRDSGKWYIAELYWRPWWRLDVPIKAVWRLWKISRDPD